MQNENNWNEIAWISLNRDFCLTLCLSDFCISFRCAAFLLKIVWIKKKKKKKQISCCPIARKGVGIIMENLKTAQIAYSGSVMLSEGGIPPCNACRDFAVSCRSYLSCVLMNEMGSWKRCKASVRHLLWNVGLVSLPATDSWWDFCLCPVCLCRYRWL